MRAKGKALGNASAFLTEAKTAASAGFPEVQPA